MSLSFSLFWCSQDLRISRFVFVMPILSLTLPDCVLCQSYAGAPNLCADIWTDVRARCLFPLLCVSLASVSNVSLFLSLTVSYTICLSEIKGTQELKICPSYADSLHDSHSFVHVLTSHTFLSHLGSSPSLSGTHLPLTLLHTFRESFNIDLADILIRNRNDTLRIREGTTLFAAYRTIEFAGVTGTVTIDSVGKRYERERDLETARERHDVCVCERETETNTTPATALN